MKIELCNLVSDVHNEEYIDSTLQGFWKILKKN